MANLTGSRSVFPNQLDSFRELVDISPSKKVQAKRYQELKMKEVLSPAEVSELNSLMTELQDFIVTPEYTNKMLDALVNLESFFLNETVGFVNTKQTEMNTYVDTKKTEMQTEINKFNNKGTFNISTQYYKNNFVDFNDDSNNQTYICLQDCMGKEPSSNPLFWRKMTIQGTKGDTGLSGANFIFKGTWDNAVTYAKDEAVRFGGSLFVSTMNTNVGNSPSLTADTVYWLRAMDITVTVRKMVGVRNLASQSNSVNFMVGEITSFNPLVDSIEVFMNSTRLTKGTDYTINQSNQAIDKISGTWDGSVETPVFFEFVVTKNIINDLIFKDGSALSNGSVTRNKLDLDTQTEINKVASIDYDLSTFENLIDKNVPLTTTAQTVVPAINELKTSLNTKVEASAINDILTPQGILDKVKQVDGAGSGLDADLLDGLHADSFVNAVAIGSTTDPNTTLESYILSNNVNSPGLGFYWHIKTDFYNARTSISNRSQVAVAYNSNPAQMYIRNYFSEWTPWTKVLRQQDYDTLFQSVVNGKQDVVNAINGSIGYTSGLTTSSTHADYSWWIQNKVATAGTLFGISAKPLFLNGVKTSVCSYHSGITITGGVARRNASVASSIQPNAPGKSLIIKLTILSGSGGGMYFQGGSGSNDSINIQNLNGTIGVNKSVVGNGGYLDFSYMPTGYYLITASSSGTVNDIYTTSLGTEVLDIEPYVL